MMNAFGKEPGLPYEPFWTFGKKLSGGIAATIVGIALVVLRVIKAIKAPID